MMSMISHDYVFSFMLGPSFFARQRRHYEVLPALQICGGGPRASTWHLRTLSPYDPLPPHADDIGIHVLELVDDRVVIGGETKT